MGLTTVQRYCAACDQMITMFISKEDKILIESLNETKGYDMRKLLKQFPQKNSTKDGLESLITC